MNQRLVDFKFIIRAAVPNDCNFGLDFVENFRVYVFITVLLRRFTGEMPLQ